MVRLRDCLKNIAKVDVTTGGWKAKYTLDIHKIELGQDGITLVNSRGSCYIALNTESWPS